MPWVCAICTYLNTVDSRSVCEMCDSAKKVMISPVASEPKAVKKPLTAPSSKQELHVPMSPASAKPSQPASPRGGGKKPMDDDLDIDDWGGDGGGGDGGGWGEEGGGGGDGDDNLDWGDEPMPKAASAAPGDDDGDVGGGEDDGSVTGYTIMDTFQIDKLQFSIIKEVGALLRLSPSDVLLLLRSHGWNKRRITDDWFGREAELREASGLPKPPASVAKEMASKEVDCGVCADTIPNRPDKALALDCGHFFCIDCWSSWIKAAVDKGPSLLFTNCPGYKCKRRVPDEVLRRFMPPPPLPKGQKKPEKLKKGARVYVVGRELGAGTVQADEGKSGAVPVQLDDGTYEQAIPVAKLRPDDILDKYIRDSFVGGKSVCIKWCPGKKCSYAARYTAGGMQGIDCRCGHSWCFACSGPSHSPLSCKATEEWLKKETDDKGTDVWFQANTKECPKCKVRIEKNQGCQHMTCRNCRHEWCWLCSKDWHGHQFCGQYDGSNAPKDDGAASARAVLERYNHFHSRYDNHRRAVNFAEKTRVECHVKMLDLQQKKGTNVKGVDFLIKAVEAVIEAHRVLQWTYPFAFYLDVPDGSSARQLFDTSQQQLETFTDQLHELTERPLESLLDEKSKQQIITRTNAIINYRRNMIDAIETSTLPTTLDKAQREKAEEAKALQSKQEKEKKAAAEAAKKTAEDKKDKKKKK